MLNCLYVAILSVISFLVLFVLCKLIGRRQISQLSMFDYANSITIGSIAADLAIDIEEWKKPLTALVIYGFITATAAIFSCKSIKLRHLMNGKPLLLYENGKLYQKNLAKAHLDLNSFLEQCRIGGYFDLSQLSMVFMEPNGQFSFLPLASERPLTAKDMSLSVKADSLWIPLIMDGRLMEKNLSSTGQTRQWLMHQLHGQGIGQISQVFFAACDSGDGFIACRKTVNPTVKEFF